MRKAGEIRPVLLEVRKEDGRFIGDLVFSDTTRWHAWQVFKRLYELKANARCTYDGPIVRVEKVGTFTLKRRLND